MAVSERQKELLGFGERPGTTCLSVGTIRSGKTYSSALGFGLYTQGLSEKYSHFILGRKLRVIENEILPVMQLVAKLTGQPSDHIYHRTDQKIRLGGQTYYLIAGSDERSSDRLQGFTVHSAMIDEATIVPESFFNMALSRLTFADSKCWMTCNPSHPLHYIKTKWIDGGKVDEHHQFTFEDNPTLTEETKDRFRAQFSGVFAQRMVHGLWYAGDGLVYPEFKTRKNPDESEVLRTDIGIDYGPASTTTWVILQSLRDGTFHIPAAYDVKGGPDQINKTDAELTEETCKIVAAHGAKSVIKDPSAASFEACLLQVPGRTFHVRNAFNDIIPGIRKAGNALATGQVTISDDTAKVRGLVGELRAYCWDEKKVDVPVKENDHYSDAMRYVVWDMVGSALTAINLPEGF